MGLNDYFNYDGEDSSTFGVYASGEGTFNAPEKEYDIYEVPGRSGDLQIFRGKYKNVTVTYPCKYQKIGSDLAQDINNFRNFLMSRDGYQRLYDTHHPEEFRMAIYKGGLEVDPTDHSLLSEFDVEFDCKPQRFLTSGEAPIDVTDGDNINNPTYFPSSPLLEVDGYGAIWINGQCIQILDDMIGTVDLVKRTSDSSTATLMAPFITHLFNDGDVIDFGDGDVDPYIQITADNMVPSSLTYVGRSVDSEITCSFSPDMYSDGSFHVHLDIYHMLFTAGTEEVRTPSAYFTFNFDTSTNGVTTSHQVVVQITVRVGIRFDMITSQKKKDVVILGTDVSITGGESVNATARKTSERKRIIGCKVRSTATKLGHPLYIDLENGQAYKYHNGRRLSINNAIDMGADLPKLEPGVNAISLASTINRLKIIPRWWKL